jgi:glucokinase
VEEEAADPSTLRERMRVPLTTSSVMSTQVKVQAEHPDAVTAYATKGPDLGVIGVDLGSSHIHAGLVLPDGSLSATRWVDIDPARGPEPIVVAIARVCRDLLVVAVETNLAIAGVGLGIPGLVDTTRGVSVFSPNLFWRDVPISAAVSVATGLPAFIENDARTATLGEAHFGAGLGVANLVCLFIGSGIGSGIIVEGKMLRGHGEAAGEVGHMTVLPDGPACNCGNRGCLEALVAGSAIAREGVRLLERHKAPRLAELAPSPALVTSALVAKAAEAGDAECREVFRRAGQYLGIALANYVNLVNPEVMIVGGGVAVAGELLLAPAREVLHTRAMPVQGRVRLAAARLGDRAGLVGAGTLAYLKLGLREGPN